MREDLVSSGAAFLSDPKVQSAPLAKKVSFLESKGMTSEEIEEAMARANGKRGAPTANDSAAAASQRLGTMVVQGAPPSLSPPLPPPVPQRPSYTWKDIFIAAVFAGGVSYGVWTLLKVYLGSWFLVPTQKKLELEKDALDMQFQAVEEALKQTQQETTDALAKIETQSKSVDESLTVLSKAMKDLKQGDAEREAEFKHLQGDVEALKDLVPRMMDRHKESQINVINGLKDEVKSLKSLLIARRPILPDSQESNSSTSAGMSSSTATSISARLSNALNATGSLNTGKPGIPAWQLATANKADGEENMSADTSNSASTSPA
ncbi:peroxisomal membrane anchor protein conserved region-domain-containing protein [Dichotomocladium elegans]|nr:peroxisomal membrane anchor protein conserved region-domain-containing protein [Dichotomocladium elegans]